jgi:5'-nucleotidase
MRVLLTNDDGIHAEGIVALHEAIADLGETVVVAPATVQSAAGHGVTFHQPLMCRRVRVNERMRGYAIEGRPADCTKVALRSLWPDLFGEGARPDVTISGMNIGANVGINVIYSGTVAAAVESAFLGVPAIAVSLHIGDPAKTCFGRAAWIARQAIDRVLAEPLEPHTVVNINVPRTEREDAPMPPLRVVPMNTAPGVDHYEKRTSPGGQIYFWPAGNGMDFAHTAAGTDVELLWSPAVTVTPLSFDLTDHARMQRWRERVEAR